MGALDGRVIAIAGAGGGLGPVVARRLADEGRDHRRDRRLAGAARRARLRSCACPRSARTAAAVDLLDDQAARGWSEALTERFSRVDACSIWSAAGAAASRCGCAPRRLRRSTTCSSARSSTRPVPSGRSGRKRPWPLRPGLPYRPSARTRRTPPTARPRRPPRAGRSPSRTPSRIPRRRRT